MTTEVCDRIAEVLDRLEGVKQTGADKWQACCPAHDDRVASLSISRGKDGRALLHCKAGCATPSVVEEIGLTMSALFPAKSNRTVDTVYDYCGPEGETRFQVVRYNPKGFSQRRQDAKGDTHWNLNGVERVL